MNLFPGSIERGQGVDLGVLVLEAKRRKWVRSRSPGLKRGRVLKMGTEEREAQEGIRKELRLKAVNRQPRVLRAVDVEKLIEADHPARAIWELVGRLNLSRFHQAIEAVEGVAGRPAFDPPLLISLWIHGYSEGYQAERDLYTCPAAKELVGSGLLNLVGDLRTDYTEMQQGGEGGGRA